MQFSLDCVTGVPISSDYMKHKNMLLIMNFL